MSIESDDITVVFIILICFNCHANAGPRTGPAPPVVPDDIANSDGESATTSLTITHEAGYEGVNGTTVG